MLERFKIKLRETRGKVHTKTHQENQVDVEYAKEALDPRVTRHLMQAADTSQNMYRRIRGKPTKPYYSRY